MPAVHLTIANHNYGSWSLRSWLLCRLAGVDVDVDVVPDDDEAARAELLHMSPSFLVPRLEHDGLAIWDTFAIGEYLNELHPEAGLLPEGPAQRAHCRSISGEMHAGFADLRSALPMNIRARHPGFKIVSGAHADIERIIDIWHECLAAYGGPFLFGAQPTIADAMYAPVCTRFVTYDIALDAVCTRYCEAVHGLDAMAEWIAAAQKEPDEIEELDIEF